MNNKPTKTPNSVIRYLANQKALGLPGLGTVINAGSKTFKIAGLSSDLKRIKAFEGDKLVDLKLDGVKVILQTLESTLAAYDEVSDVTQAAGLLDGIFKKAA